MTNPDGFFEPTEVNRLILVGNGFDLAHGLNTGYNDFMLWYLKKAFSLAKKDGQYNDDLLSITFTNGDAFGMLRGPGIKTAADFIDYFYNVGFDKLIGQTYLHFEGWSNDYQNPFQIRLRTPLIQTLVYHCSQANWVEIENVFYDMLKEALMGSIPSEKAKKVESLNISLAALIEKLHEYLSQIDTGKKVEGYEQIINNKYQPTDFVDKELRNHMQCKLADTQILNFNYTSTIEKYVEPSSLTDKRIEINYIHGRLNDKKNPIIFGFGDELDQDYSGFELEKTKGVFEYIKSFWYFRTPNYHELIRFIDSRPFQVYILGHSCGLSDRTMLNMIFEHENCHSIKIFFYGNEFSNNFKIITQEISRHFKDKQQMRRKIVSLERSCPMPQAEG